MDYKITSLSGELVYIRWYNSPPIGSPTHRQFIADLKKLLDEAEQPIYFISDLRRGRITNIEVLRKLGRLASHPKWAGSTAFSKDPMTSMFVGVFTRFAKHAKSEDEIWDTPEEAIAFLESLKEGLMKDIDWRSVLADEPANNSIP